MAGRALRVVVAGAAGAAAVVLKRASRVRAQAHTIHMCERGT